ncbi:MAG: lactonase family protein [Clostridia bacterium]|nr:lactonase family protein [Clostridia bacterium]
MKDLYFCSCDTNGGIYHYKIIGTKLEFCEKTELDRPMYMVIEDNKAHVILREIESENNFGGILNFDIDDNGALVNPSEIVSTKGVVPCHLTVVDNVPFVVNYISGNLAKIPEKTVTHCGKGPHPTRQTAPHTHFVTYMPDKKHLLCVDLGLDTIFCYDKDLNQVSTAKVPAGHGARHLAFSKDNKLLYCVNELASTVSVFKVEGTNFTLLNTYEALPDFHDKNTAAAIRICEDYLYISNRGANTITKFKISGEKLELISNFDCGGEGPRDFDIVDGLFFCTNEQTNDVTILREKGNNLELIEKIPMADPLCVVIR